MVEFTYKGMHVSCKENSDICTVTSPKDGTYTTSKKKIARHLAKLLATKDLTAEQLLNMTPEEFENRVKEHYRKIMSLMNRQSIEL